MSRNAWDLIKSKVWGSKEVIPNEVIKFRGSAHLSIRLQELDGIGVSSSRLLFGIPAARQRWGYALHRTWKAVQRCWRYSRFISTSFFITLPETNSSHLKHWGWEMSFLFGFSAYRCELLVFGGAYSRPSQHPKNLIRGTVCYVR